MDGNTMRHDTHIPDQELMMAADGELPERRLGEVRSHLAACSMCASRAKELDDAMAAFVEMQRHSDSQLPPADGPRALLRARLAALAAEPPPRATGFSQSQWAWAGIAAVLVMMAGLTILRRHADNEAGLVPNLRLTPGAVLLSNERDVCGAATPGKARFIPAAMGQKVFAEYGIRSPQPRAYELDYLIAPELGGSDDIRNVWPQPYSTAVWNSHVKDALEDRLHELVCSDQISLATAQHDIAANWVAAYQKYFKTKTPLPDHYAFAKDRPWEQ
jgi:hypothetical protein